MPGQVLTVTLQRLLGIGHHDGVRTSGDITAVAELCEQLDGEPLLHLSLHSKELFHSNVLGWLFEKYPQPAAAILEGLVPARAASRPAPIVRREYRYLDLVVELPGLAPVVIENKVFSLPDTAQLERYARDALEGLDDPALILLSFTSPGWPGDTFATGDRSWRWLSYDELSRRVTLVAGAIRTGGYVDATFAADLLDHYANLIDRLRRLALAVGEPHETDGVELRSEILDQLRRVRLHDALSKARARALLNTLRQQLGDVVGGRIVQWKSDFTRGNVLLEAFVPTASGDRIGWQLQGGQWRLAVITAAHVGRTEEARAQRHRYVADHYGDWFDFGPLTEVAGARNAPRSERAGEFNRYDPDFVYRYRLVADLTVTHLVELASIYQRRATRWA